MLESANIFHLSLWFQIWMSVFLRGSSVLTMPNASIWLEISPVNVQLDT